jgi:hypothetical protein
MPRPDFAEVWTTTRDAIAAEDERLVSDVRSAWKCLAEILDSARDRFRIEPDPRPEAGSRADLEHFVQDAGDRFLFSIAAEISKLRPIEKVLQSLERHHLDVEDVLRETPASLTASGEQIYAAIGPSRSLPVRARILRLRRKPREIAFRGVVARHLEARANARLTTDGRCSLLLCQTLLHIVQPWQHLRRSTFRALAGGAAGEDLAILRARWFARTAALGREAADIFRFYERWLQDSPDALTRDVAVRALRRPGRHQPAEPRQHAVSYWSRLQRAVHTVLQMEIEMAHLTLASCGLARDSLLALGEEHGALVEELDSVIRWLGDWQAGNSPGPFPAAKANVATGDERAAEWTHRMEALAAAGLAPRIETSNPRQPLPPRRSPWRTIHPVRIFLDALHRVGTAPPLEGFRDYASRHQAILREIERAREVVDYSLEVLTADIKSGREIAAEGIANALSLTLYQRRILSDAGATVERRLVEASAITLQATYLRLEQSRLGLIATLAQRTAAGAAKQFGILLFRAIRSTASRAGERAARAYHLVLMKVGWETPPIPVESPVVTRGYLNDILNLGSGCELPMIYRRLFRLAPVEEPRFLVGREAEMAALVHAKRLWEANRNVTVLIVGARGSGKTSLLNCAIAGPFDHASIIRSQFSERIAGADGMRRFLANLVGADAESDLLAALTGERRIIILEELERTFLRSMHGFDGLREFLRIISASTPATLWIVALNQHAHLYLDAAVGLGQSFSHRINAMAVPPEDLRAAILLRHNLSGLRLEYPPSPPSDPRLSRVRSVLGFRRRPEDFFFDALYRHSEGIFRTAFELWLQYMQRVEGGVVSLAQPTEPDYDLVISQLVLDDALCLQAVLQHGGLTEQEHAEIFGCPAEGSRERIERLLALEILEPEPEAAGFRIRPEAQRTVHVALHRLNLL